MTAIAHALRVRRPARSANDATERAALPPLAGGALLARTLLVMVLLVSGGFLAQIVLLTPLQERAAQQRLFDRFRAELAAGTAPIGPAGPDGRLLPIGSPVAYLEIPAIGLRQVVVEGTTGGALAKGPGHRRDSMLPGQAGVSVVLGRSTAYGRPFSRLGKLEVGDAIRITTGQGAFDYRVIGQRHDGDPLPPALERNGGRIVLATADGGPFLPDGVVRVDADLRGEAVAGERRPFTPKSLPSRENTMAGDTSELWSLALWLEVLLGLALAVVWSWRRWGRAQTWVVLLPPVALVSLYVANSTLLLLPNLL